MAALANNKRKVSSAGDFKKAVYTDLMLPSGNVVAAKRIGVQAFLATGKIPNSLLPIMNGALTGKQSAPDLEAMDPAMIADAMVMFDVAAIQCVVQPVVHEVPADIKNADGTTSPGPRSDELLYVDEMDLEDKQFIFSWVVGGTSDVAKFRESTQQELAAVRAGRQVGLPAKRPAQPRR